MLLLARYARSAAITRLTWVVWIMFHLFAQWPQCRVFLPFGVCYFENIAHKQYVPSRSSIKTNSILHAFYSMQFEDDSRFAPLIW